MEINYITKYVIKRTTIETKITCSNSEVNFVTIEKTSSIKINWASSTFVLVFY